MLKLLTGAISSAIFFTATASAAPITFTVHGTITDVADRLSSRFQAGDSMQMFFALSDNPQRGVSDMTTGRYSQAVTDAWSQTGSFGLSFLHPFISPMSSATFTNDATDGSGQLFDRVILTTALIAFPPNTPASYRMNSYLGDNVVVNGLTLIGFSLSLLGYAESDNQPDLLNDPYFRWDLPTLISEADERTMSLLYFDTVAFDNAGRPRESISKYYYRITASLDGIAGMPVPEPSAIGLLGLGILGIAGLRRRTA